MGLAESRPADSAFAHAARDERRGRARALPKDCECILRIAAALGNLQRLRRLCGFSRVVRETEGCRRGSCLHDRQFTRGGFDRGDEERETCILPKAAYAYDL